MDGVAVRLLHQTTSAFCLVRRLRSSDGRIRPPLMRREKVSYASIRELLRVTIVALAAMVAGCADSRGTDPGPGPPAPITPTPPSAPTPAGSTEYVFVANADGTGATQLTKGGQASWS